MAGRPVHAVWVWRYTKAPYKATYGRRAGTTYSKDFLQASGECGTALDLVSGRGRGQRIDLRFDWPGGHRIGSLFEAADFDEIGRLEVRWETNNAPAPWKLYPDGDADPLKTFPGDSTHTIASDADEEYELLRSRNLDPWLVVVKLFNEGSVLHVRAYLGNPPPKLSHTDTAQLPSRVQAAMARVPARGGCAVAIEDRDAAQRTGGMAFDPERIHDAWSEVDAARFGALLTTPAPPVPLSPLPRSFSAPYRRANTAVKTASAKVFARDPNEVDRSLQGHNATQEALAAHVTAAGLTPGSSIDPLCDYDLAWERDGVIWVAEVKSLTDDNERLQLRLGLGQVLDYAHRLRLDGWDVQPVLAVERQPLDDAWLEICEDLGVRLVSPETMETLFAP